MALSRPMVMVLPTTGGEDTEMIVYDSVDDFVRLEPSWNAAAFRAPSPSLTHEWYVAWWRAFGGGMAMALAEFGRDGRFLGGAALMRRPARTIAAAANDYTDDWDVVAVDDSARAGLWRRIARLPAAQLRFGGLPGPGGSAAAASKALAEAGYRLSVSRQELSPYLVLPETWDELLGTISRSQRSKLRRYRRRLEQEGSLRLQTVTGTDSSLDAALDRFFEVEASGWKGAGGTAILQRPAAHRFYRDFAHAAAAKGWLRLYLLELDGVTIAGAYSCVLGDTVFLLKSGFDERHRHLAPGVVLRAETLREAVSEGLARYEFMGSADPHKLHWVPELRERSVVSAYRGLALSAYLYRHKARPLARRIRDRIRPDSK